MGDGSILKAFTGTSYLNHNLIHKSKKMNGDYLYDVFIEMEMPVQKSLIEMEQTGMALDRHALDVLSEQISDYIGELETELFNLHGKRFTVTSSKSVAHVLKIRKKNGAMASKCTRAQLLQCTQPMAKLILEHRSLHAILAKSIQPLHRKTSDNNRYYRK